MEKEGVFTIALRYLYHVMMLVNSFLFCLLVSWECLDQFLLYHFIIVHDRDFPIAFIRMLCLVDLLVMHEFEFGNSLFCICR